LVFTASITELFQVLSVKMGGTMVSSRTAATEEVSTTRFVVVPYFRTEFRIEVVPRTAGMMRSKYIYILFVQKGQPSWEEKVDQHTVWVVRLEVKRRGGVGDGVDTPDGLIKCPILGDIFDNDELKPIPIIGKSIFKECTFGQ
jgi:hypothetical protein